MTADHIHDALTLLPADLIAEVDKKRSGKPRIIRWKRVAAMAACFALVLCSALLCLPMFAGMGGSSEEAAAEAPMMQAPQEISGVRADPALPETQAAAAAEEPASAKVSAEEETLCALPTAPAQAEGTAEDAQTNSTNQNGSPTNDQALYIDHSHIPAEASEEVGTAANGWCGNTSAVLYIDGEAHTIWGSDAITVTDILSNLEYDPANLCRCVADHRADTELTTGYEISLEHYFVRYNGGQAALTVEQADALTKIINGLTLEDSLNPQMETAPEGLSFFTNQVITPSLDGYHSDYHTTLITSRTEMEEYWNTFSDRYDFSGMKSTCDLYGYDDAWFEENDLLLNVVFSRVGVTYDITSIIDAGGDHGWEWEVLVSLKGEYYPDNEEATYHLLTRLEKGILSPDDDIIGVMDTRGMEQYLEE